MSHHDEIRKEILKGEANRAQTKAGGSRIPISLLVTAKGRVDSFDVPVELRISDVLNAIMDDLADDDTDHGTICSWKGVLRRKDFERRAVHYETYVLRPSKQDKAMAAKLRAYAASWDDPKPAHSYAGQPPAPAIMAKAG